MRGDVVVLPRDVTVPDVGAGCCALVGLADEAPQLQTLVVVERPVVLQLAQRVGALSHELQHHGLLFTCNQGMSYYSIATKA